MPSPANYPEYHLTLRQANQACGDFAAILDELDSMKWQLARLPSYSTTRRPFDSRVGEREGSVLSSLKVLQGDANCVA
jgi:hypothetical protein